MAYPVSFWSKLRAEYETGNFTIPGLHEKYKVSEVSINKHIAREHWEKGKIAGQIQHLKQQKTIDLFAEKGFTRDTAAAKVIECIETAKRTVFEGKGEQMIATPESDWDKILKALDMYHKLIDAYPAQRIEIDIKEVQTKIIGVLVEFRDSLPEEKREHFKQRISEVLL